MNKNERLLLNTELLKTFVCIADCGNLTTAAGHLCRTQSAISVQVRKLETDLNVSLFRRNSRGMTLTEDGNKLLPKARSILKDIRQASVLFKAPLTGSIRIGIPDDFNDIILKRILTDFSRIHPGVNVIATSGCTSGYSAAVSNGELDMAVLSGPKSDEGELLDKEKIVWAAKKSMRIDDKLPVPLAILDRSCWWHNLSATALNSAERDYTVAFLSSSFASIQSAIRAGFAVGVIPASCVCSKMSVLTEVNGFPKLPISYRSILRGVDVPDDLASAMTQAIKDARLQ